MDEKTIYLLGLGCAKNLVDAEYMEGMLIRKGWDFVDDPAEASVIIVNTCAFIRPAVEESIDGILEMAGFRRKGKLEKLIVTGCLSQRYGNELADSLPEVDVFLGPCAYSTIPEYLEKKEEKQRIHLPDPNSLPFPDRDSGAFRAVSTGPFAYLKISEGCDRRCTYCIIPVLRGKQRSRHPEDILKEAEMLVEKGVKELVLVAQETTAYGKDISGKSLLPELLAKLAERFDDVWIRMMYGHPASLDQKTIETIAGHSNLLPYFDLPVQHASEKILHKMGRQYTKDSLLATVEHIRKTIDEAVLRTTVITGFPGETEKDFKYLYDFIEAVQFDHLGVFSYSDDEKLLSHRLKDHVPEKTAEARKDRIMELQAEISGDRLLKYLGKKVCVLLEEDTEEKELLVGRSWFQAPEVDGLTYVKTGKGRIGQMVEVVITNTMEYDITGEHK